MFTERVLKGEFDDLPEDAPKGTLRFKGFMGGIQHEVPMSGQAGGQGDDPEYDAELEKEMREEEKEKRGYRTKRRGKKAQDEL